MTDDSEEKKLFGIIIGLAVAVLLILLIMILALVGVRKRYKTHSPCIYSNIFGCLSLPSLLHPDQCCLFCPTVLCIVLHCPKQLFYKSLDLYFGAVFLPFKTPFHFSCHSLLGLPHLSLALLVFFFFQSQEEAEGPPCPEIGFSAPSECSTARACYPWD